MTQRDDVHWRERWLAAAAAAAFVGVWEVASRSGLISTLFFPPPSTIIRTLAAALESGTLGGHLTATLTRVTVGVVVGGVPGVLLGLLMGWQPRFRAFADPLISTLHPIPKIAVLPLLMMVFGLGEASKIAVVAIGVFFPMTINAVAGVRQIPVVYFEAAQAYGATRLQTLAYVVLPGSLPLILTGLRLSLNIALLLSIAVELVAAQHGLGKMIWFAWQTMRTEELFAALFVIAAVGIGFSVAVSTVRTILTPWNIDRQR